MKTKPCIDGRIRLVLAAALAALTVTASNVSYTYDLAGRLISADYGTNTISYAYDPAGNLRLLSMPRPGLMIGPRVGNQFTLSWPAAPVGFVLESASTLGAGAAWSTNGIPSSNPNGNLLTVTLPIGDATKFYRLRKP